MKTLVYIDHFKGQVQPAAWEALGVAKTFGSAAAVIFGSGLEALTKAAFEFGADEVWLQTIPACRITAPKHLPPH